MFDFPRPITRRKALSTKKCIETVFFADDGSHGPVSESTEHQKVH